MREATTRRLKPYYVGAKLRRARRSHNLIALALGAEEAGWDGLFETVAQGLRIFRESDWIEQIAHDQTMLVVTAKQPEVDHNIRMRDFEHWFESEGRTPAEVALKNRTRELLKPYSATVGSRAIIVRYPRRLDASSR